MKFGVFYEHQLPRPWAEGAEEKLLHEALDQVELADRLGIDFAWEVEHHFLEEYSHSPAPEGVPRRRFAAHAQHPARARHHADAARIQPPCARGRAHRDARPRLARPRRVGHRHVGLAHRDRRLRHRSRAAPGDVAGIGRAGGNMLVMDPYPGFEGKFFSMPVRNVVPKPGTKAAPAALAGLLQSQHDPHRARRTASGALTFAFIDPAEAREWVEEYYEIFKRECVPIGHTVNPNIAMVTGFSCHADVEEARRRGNDGFRFFQFALGHYYAFGRHAPGRTDIWKKYEAVRDELGTEVLGGGTGCIGSPADLRAALRTFADAGVDQTV
jgi:alkanesulfonate monooxygenase SsuD/methylene tetrahydromethanopterin reductase-like flavin-dependent oxidoreductase (luciferase family)